MGTVVVSAGLLTAVALVIRGMIQDKKQGKTGCGGDCSRCRGCH